MKPYLVVGASEKKLVLEDLSLNNRDRKQKISVERMDADMLLVPEGKRATIQKILPDGFKLSPFNDGDGRLIFDGERILYDLAPAMVDFTDKMKIEIGSIIGISDWI